MTFAYQNPTHFVWNIPIKDAKPFIQEEDYKSSKLQSMMDDLGKCHQLAN